MHIGLKAQQSGNKNLVDLANIKPLVLADPRKAMVSTHAYLKELIYSNALPAGTIISQVELANALGVSRTPLREALRMLQEEGLIRAEANRRCRVAGFRPEDLDAQYASRLLIEALGMRISIPQLRETDLKEIETIITRMEAIEAEGTKAHSGITAEWINLHRDFHSKLIFKCPDTLLEQYRQMTERCERYFMAAVGPRKFGSTTRHGEHRRLLDIITSGAFDLAVVANAQHRTRTAITFLAETAIDFEPVAIRAALKLISAEPETRASADFSEAA